MSKCDEPCSFPQNTETPMLMNECTREEMSTINDIVVKIIFWCEFRLNSIKRLVQRHGNGNRWNICVLISSRKHIVLVRLLPVLTTKQTTRITTIRRTVCDYPLILCLHWCFFSWSKWLILKFSFRILLKRKKRNKSFGETLCDNRNSLKI